MRKVLLAILFITIMMLTISVASSEKTPTYKVTMPNGPKLEYYFDKSELDLGETITLYYSITDYDYCDDKIIEYQWHINENGYTADLESGTLSSLQGQLRYTPKYGGSLYFNFRVVAKDGTWTGWYSNAYNKYIRIYGPAVEPLSIELKQNKYSVYCGDEVRIEYKITGGSGKYDTIRYSWRLDDGTIHNQPWKWGDLTSSEGTLSLIPEFGQKLHFELMVIDNRGFRKDATIYGINLLNSPTKPLEIRVYFNKTTVAIGETVNASYEITGGSGVYTSIKYQWEYLSDNGNTYDFTESYVSDKATGTVSFIPFDGEQLRFHITVVDSRGFFQYLEQSYNGQQTPEVVILGANTTITIPESARIISNNAFSETNAEVAIVPTTTETIMSEAFSNMSNLKRVLIKNSKCKILDGAFKGIENNVVIVAPNDYCYVARRAREMGLRVESNE